MVEDGITTGLLELLAQLNQNMLWLLENTLK